MGRQARTGRALVWAAVGTIALFGAVDRAGGGEHGGRARVVRVDDGAAVLRRGAFVPVVASDEVEEIWPGRSLMLVYECPRCSSGVGFVPLVAAADEIEGPAICSTVYVSFAVGVDQRPLDSLADVLDAYDAGEISLYSPGQRYDCSLSRP